MNDNINGAVIEHAAQVAAQISSMAFVLSVAAGSDGSVCSDLAPTLDLLAQLTREHELELQALDNST